jgi:uncharacterized protein (TIGR02996 family)
MYVAVLNLARGNLSSLEEYIACAETDFRDVLWFGEPQQPEDRFERLRCIECDPGEEAVDPAEEAFLEGIRANPADNTARLVYADWLEERGDPRAEYLRVLCQWLTCRRPTDAQPLIGRERELRGPRGRGWLARIRGMPVREKTPSRKG